MAITQALFKGYERSGTSYRVRVAITDDAKPTYSVWLTVAGTTLAELTAQASRQLAALVAADSQADLLANIAVDTAIPITYTEPTVTPTADDTWLANVRLLVRAKAAQSAGLTSSAFTTDLAGLTATVISGYTTARAQKL